ncbi:MAG: hypothetical protein KDK34_23535, partial [Leptospiraceae bacterium]|nr:hypothetical protein [Leptospiraceae bacterium]
MYRTEYDGQSRIGGGPSGLGDRFPRGRSRIRIQGNADANLHLNVLSNNNSEFKLRAIKVKYSVTLADHTLIDQRRESI